MSIHAFIVYIQTPHLPSSWTFSYVMERLFLAYHVEQIKVFHNSLGCYIYISPQYSKCITSALAKVLPAFEAYSRVAARL